MTDDSGDLQLAVYYFASKLKTVVHHCHLSSVIRHLSSFTAEFTATSSEKFLIVF